MNTQHITTALDTLFSELTHGAHDRSAYVLNSGDAGLLGSLDRMSASDASSTSHDGATVAAHADHVRYGLSLMNRWKHGANPFADADWSASWRITTVDDAAWTRIRADLRREADAWRDALRTPRDTDEMGLAGMIGSVVHLAYHLGAIRQISKSARGPREEENRAAG